MTIAGLIKVTATLFGLGAAVLALEPTVKVAIIVAIPSAITGAGTVVLGFLNRRDAQAIRSHVVELKQDMGAVTKSVNGVKDELVRVVKKEAFAAGEKKERDDPHEKPK